MARFLLCSLVTIAVSGAGLGQNSLLPPGAKVFIADPAGFGADLTVALLFTNTPIVIVKDQKAADFEVTARRIVRNPNPSDRIEEATVTVTDIRAGVVLDAYTLTADSSAALARAAAKRFQDVLALPPNRVSTIREPRPSASVPISATPRFLSRATSTIWRISSRPFAPNCARLG